MSDQNKAVVKSLFDELSKGNIAAVDTSLADGFVEHEELPPGLPAGKEGVKALFTMMGSAFPGFQMVIGHLVAEADLVSAFVTIKGTHRGEFMGIPATGKAVAVNISDLMRVQNGKITEHWGVMDMAGLMQQLGVGAP